MKKADSGKIKINLALQGGGSHGAFTWGVLERLSQDDRIEIESISATSAGAMNASIFAYGMIVGGAVGARELLEKFWRQVSDSMRMSPLQPSFFEKMMGINDVNFSPMFKAVDFMRCVFSPYQLNFWDVNPLREILNDLIDFEVLRSKSKIKLFVNATNLTTSKIRVFSLDDLSDKALLASACLPYIAQTVTIDDEKYWDGGFSGNPSLSPLINNSDISDILVVRIVPFNDDETPTTMPEIIDRVNEISFSNSFFQEVKAIQIVNSNIESMKQKRIGHYRPIRLHQIANDEIIGSLGRTSKLNADWEFLTYLKDVGSQTANDWLENNLSKIGKSSTFVI